MCVMCFFDKTYDFTVDEYYDTDRSDKPWAEDDEELNELWRKVIKSQVLNLKLNGKAEKDIRDTMEKRYRRFQKNIDQYTSEDVFELYMKHIGGELRSAYELFFASYFRSFSSKHELIAGRDRGKAGLQIVIFTKVAQVMPGGPAEKSKMLHENDLIIGVAQGVDGEMVDVIGWRIDDVVQLIKGPKGTTVRLEILGAKTGVNGPSKVITLVREKK